MEHCSNTLKTNLKNLHLMCLSYSSSRKVGEKLLGKSWKKLLSILDLRAIESILLYSCLFNPQETLVVSNVTNPHLIPFMV